MGLMVFGLSVLIITAANAQKKLVFVTPPNTIDTFTSEVITRRAYKRIGIDVKIKKFPGERALRLANSGKVDGEVQRINGIAAKYLNLTDISHIIFKQGLIVGRSGHRWKEFRSAAIRQSRFVNLAVGGSLLAQFCRHPDTPLLSLSSCR